MHVTNYAKLEADLKLAHVRNNTFLTRRDVRKSLRPDFSWDRDGRHDHVYGPSFS